MSEYVFRVRYSGVVIRTISHRVLLQERDTEPTIRNPGRLSLFGGIARLLESGKQAACREIREELSVICTLSDLVEVDSFDKVESDGSVTRCTFYALTVDVDPDELVVREGIGYRDLALASALENDDLTDSARRALECWRDRVED